jgi:Zn-finger nucleic acid-binding protein
MALDCPRCKHVPLEEIELGDVPVDRCARCAGIWFDNAEVGELTRLKNKLQGFESLVPPSTYDTEDMLCPRCNGVSLRRLVVPSDGRDRILFRCVSCLGTWVDRGELREIEDRRLVESLTEFFSGIRNAPPAEAE